MRKNFMKQLSLTALALSFLFLTSSALCQNVAGRWFATGNTLDNGEVEKALLVLKQNGNQLSGKLEELGFVVEVTGTVSGNHIELHGAGFSDPKPFLIGDLVNGELHWKQWGGPMVAHRATATDTIPVPPYIAPPPLHKVPYNGLAKTPPMGWNSWNLFAGKVNDQIIRTMADAMVSSGMRDAGYIYINIDDTWEGTRDAQGNIRPNSKFPNMKALADYVHSKGLKFGIYSSPGPRTCAGYPASYGHEAQDARTFASWGVDYLKYDWCSASMIYKNSQEAAVYQKMGEALEATGRPIVYSLSIGQITAAQWAPAAGANLWRTTDDIRDTWHSMTYNIEKQVPTAPYAGPGHWNDPDMLEIGNGGMTDTEYRTHMSLWALAAAPLLAGNDIRHMSDATKAILLNREVIAVDQDPLGKQASPIAHGNLQTWIKPLADGSVAVGVVNLGASPAQARVVAADLPLHGQVGRARDLWAHKEVNFTNGAYSSTVPSHGTLLLRVSRQ